MLPLLLVATAGLSSVVPAVSLLAPGSESFTPSSLDSSVSEDVITLGCLAVLSVTRWSHSHDREWQQGMQSITRSTVPFKVAIMCHAARKALKRKPVAVSRGIGARGDGADVSRR
jgi:hypothetical protein